MSRNEHPVWLQLQFSDKEPLYDQIKTRIREAILRGDLAEGEAVPTFRKLAADLRVSLITVKRAYDDLSAEGVLQGQTGRGTFVAKGAFDLCLKKQEERAIQLLELAIRVARKGKRTDTWVRNEVSRLLKTSPP